MMLKGIIILKRYSENFIRAGSIPLELEKKKKEKFKLKLKIRRKEMMNSIFLM